MQAIQLLYNSHDVYKYFINYCDFWLPKLLTDGYVQITVGDN